MYKLKIKISKLVSCLIFFLSLSTYSLYHPCFAECPLNSYLSFLNNLKWISPEDPNYWMRLGGRIQADETLFTGNHLYKGPDYPSGGNIRRVHLDLSGGLGEYFKYEIYLRFKPPIADFDKAYLQYSGLSEDSYIRVGQFKPLLTIETYSSNLDYFFLEPSLASTAFFNRDDRGMGILINKAFCDVLTIGATLYQPRQNNDIIPNNVNSDNNYWVAAKSDRLGEALRITFSPIHTLKHAFHFAINGRHQSLNATFNGVQVLQNNLFATRPEAESRETPSLVSTNNQIRGKSYNHGAIEAAAIIGPLSFMSEYHVVEVFRVPRTGRQRLPDVGNVFLRGWFVQTGFTLTGESRPYNFEDGTLGSIKPKAWYGAWEIVARTSYVNLTDKSVFGGSEHNTSFGLNWFANHNIRIGANFIRANIHPALPNNIPRNFVAKRVLNIFAIRFQVAW